LAFGHAGASIFTSRFLVENLVPMQEISALLHRSERELKT